MASQAPEKNVIIVPLDPPGAPPDENENEGTNVVSRGLTCMKDACAGAAYDASHFNEIPGDNFLGKVKTVCTRGGRLPYLFLLVAICFFSFFIFIKIGQCLFGKTAKQSPTEITGKKLVLSAGANFNHPSIGPATQRFQSSQYAPKQLNAPNAPNLVPQGHYMV